MSSRLLVTADPHFIAAFAGPVREAIVQQAEFLRERETPIDAVVVAGDLADMKDSPPGQNLRELLELLRESFAAPVAFCAGNHDVWVPPDAPFDSWAVYTEMLPAIARDTGTHFLDRMGPLELPGLTVVGTMGHYDYSLGVPDLTVDRMPVTHAHYASKIPPNRATPVFNDARFIRWPFTDESAVDEIAIAFAADLRRAVARGLPLLVATHTVPRAEANGWLELNMANGEEFGLFLTAFAGTKKLHDIICRECEPLMADAFGDPRVRCVSGHTHFRVPPFIDDGIEWWNNGSDYGEPVFDLVTFP